MTVIHLLIQARRADMKLERKAKPGEADTLTVKGPPSSSGLAKALLARKEHVLEAVDFYSGRTAVLNWRQATTLVTPRPCVACGMPCMFLDPWDDVAAHKTCVEDAVTNAAVATQSAAA